MRRLVPLFPGPRGLSAWHKAFLGGDPFRGCGPAPSAAFFRPAAGLCRAPSAAESSLPASIPAALRRRAALSLRLWQASQKVTEDLVRSGRSLAGMDADMTMNFAMALGNYSRFLLFSSRGLAPEAQLALHRAFAAEMTAMPAAMALPRPSRKSAARFTPAASARRLAAAFALALGEGK